MEKGKLYQLIDIDGKVRSSEGLKYLCYTARSANEVVEDLREVSQKVVKGEKSEDGGHSVTGEVSVVISSAEVTSSAIA